MRTLLFVCLLLSAHYYACAESINLLDAYKAGKIKLSAKGKGGHFGDCLELSLKNISKVKQDIQIIPGLLFAVQDSAAQNLMVVGAYRLALMPNETRKLSVFTMCIEQHDLSPAAEDVFMLRGEATGHLASLAEIIAEKKYRNSTAQASVWALTDKAPMSDIYSSDTAMAYTLAKFVAMATGRAMPKVIVPKEHYIYSIRMNLSHHFAKSTRATLVCYDSTGKPLKEYYKNRLIPTGMYLATFGINCVADKGTKFIYRLTDEKGTVLKERVITESINEAKPKKWKLAVSFEYILEKPVAKATMSLYTEQGELLEDLYTNRPLPAGGRRQAYSFQHIYGNKSTFYIRLKDETGNVLVEKKIDGSASTLVP